eukprot:1713440-Pyramimonas_sp.AAC.1
MQHETAGARHGHVTSQGNGPCGGSSSPPATPMMVGSVALKKSLKAKAQAASEGWEHLTTQPPLTGW